MPTDNGQPQPAGGLPASFDREFQLWRYNLSHSELKLRSFGRASTRDFIEVTFYGVIGMKLKSAYRSLTISSAEPTQVDEILRFSEVRESDFSRFRCLALKSDSGDGLVACLSYSVWSHSKDSDHDAVGAGNPDSVLILRG
ncbi:hypothetical protein ACGF0D_42755 [Kitasatospora sp. NPDC048298]|uniref:hypothetical protein n=1 Tax=Kitasatospora sp. NPDC048298 TaxID=3364049 RepID=UPI003714C74A